MTVTTLATAPFVANIQVLISPAARRSKEALHNFIRDAPADTRLEFTTMRFMPYPKRRTVLLSTLRPLQQTIWRLANLEQLPILDKVPKEHRGVKVPWWMRATVGQFYIRPGERFSKASAAPGVWDMLLQRIKGQTGPVVSSSVQTRSRVLEWKAK